MRTRSEILREVERLEASVARDRKGATGWRVINSPGEFPGIGAGPCVIGPYYSLPAAVRKVRLQLDALED
ncbi:MAG: hypothetical protein ACTHL8_05375 [Burkholderiaceae bacterium]